MLLGYYRIPAASSEPLEVVVNPQGAEERARVRRPRLRLLRTSCCRKCPLFPAPVPLARPCLPLSAAPHAPSVPCLQPQVWNTGDARCKLVTLALTKHPRAAEAGAAPATAQQHRRLQRRGDV